MKIQEERVLLLMEENGITQRKMAQDLAISPTTLNGYQPCEQHTSPRNCQGYRLREDRYG